jgi:hypothetical protein
VVLSGCSGTPSSSEDQASSEPLGSQLLENTWEADNGYRHAVTAGCRAAFGYDFPYNPSLEICTGSLLDGANDPNYSPPSPADNMQVWRAKATVEGYGHVLGILDQLKAEPTCDSDFCFSREELELDPTASIEQQAREVELLYEAVVSTYPLATSPMIVRPRLEADIPARP